MAKIREPEARAAYLAMGPDRNLRELTAKFQRDGSVISERTMFRWSTECEWQRLAAEYDENVIRRVMGRAQTAQAKSTFDAIKALTDAAEIVLEAVALKQAAIAAAEKGDVKGMISAAVEALKLKEVLNGGVSDRTGTVSEREREAEDVIAELEARFRSGNPKTPNVAQGGTA